MSFSGAAAQYAKNSNDSTSASDDLFQTCSPSSPAKDDDFNPRLFSHSIVFFSNFRACKIYCVTLSIADLMRLVRTVKSLETSPKLSEILNRLPLKLLRLMSLQILAMPLCLPTLPVMYFFNAYVLFYIGK